jgi:hypothetical protein
MHNPGVSRRGIKKSCLRTTPRPSSPATGLAHRAAIQTPSFPDAQLRIVDGASASDLESRDSGLDASHRPGMTESELSDASLLAKTVILREMSSPETCTLRLLDSITDALEY